MSEMGQQLLKVTKDTKLWIVMILHPLKEDRLFPSVQPMGPYVRVR